MLRIGLTGGIGSGKTTVGRVFSTLGVPVFEADMEGRKVFDSQADVQVAISKRFGSALIHQGTVDRKALAAIVFHDRQALADLNAIVHPAVRSAFNRWAAEQTAPYVIMESAILAESGGHTFFDQMIVVTAPEALRVARVMRRDGVEERAVLDRMANQAGEAERLSIADHIIHNDDSQLVIPQVLQIHERLLSAPIQ